MRIIQAETAQENAGGKHRPADPAALGLLAPDDAQDQTDHSHCRTRGHQIGQCGVACEKRIGGAVHIEAADDQQIDLRHAAGYQRYFTGPDGTVYQHILDPKTGWPVQGDLLSVTIVADNGTMADAYSTALYVMGREAAQDFWRQNGGFDMVLITKDGQVLYTPGLADKLTETEGSGYAYASIEP